MIKKLKIGYFYKVGWADDLMISEVISGPDEDNVYLFNDAIILAGNTVKTQWTATLSELQTIEKMGKIDDFPEYFL